MTDADVNFKYEDIEDKKRFRVEPSRRKTNKRADPEQMKIFAERQKRLPALWRDMGVVAWKIKDSRSDGPDAG